jgi:hypothetical protein
MKLRNILAAVAVLTLSATAFAHGEFKCDVPKAQWQPQMALQRKLEADGWHKVRQVKAENGCYEVYGFDEKNQRAEKFYNPKTFELVGEVRQK